MPAAAPPPVSVRVLLFASYAESLGTDSLDLTLSSPATVGDVLARVRSVSGGGVLPPKPLCARNLAHASPADLVSDGDEIAILPPLAGG